MVAAAQAYNAYQNANVYEGMDPNRLILMLYEGALRHLDFSKEGILTGDVQKRGEHLGRVIAIVAELNASLDSKVNDEPIEFLRGLYHAIILDLPKVAVTNDVSIIDRAHKYLSFLCEIWKKSVIGEDCKENQKEDSKMDVVPGRTVERNAYEHLPPRVPARAANAYANAAKLNGVSFSV